MRCWKLILIKRPAFFARIESAPSVVPFGCFSSCKSRSEFCEGFVKPQIIPPLHGHVVAEPHVCKLVQNCYNAALSISVCNFGFKHVLVANCNHTNVFHSSSVVFWHVNLIVLCVRVWHSPSLSVESKAFLRNIEQVVNVFCKSVFKCLTAVHCHWHYAAVFIVVRRVPFGVRACADSS